MGFDRKLTTSRILDEGCVLVPFAFQINGTSDPNNVQGDIVTSRAVTRAVAGRFTFVLTNKPYSVVGGGCTISGGASEDIYPQLDHSAATTTGVITIRTKTGATETDPADDNFVTGFLICKMTARRAGP